MIVMQYGLPIEISGRTLVVVSRVNLAGIQRHGKIVFFGDKRPIAIIHRGDGGEEIFEIDSQRLNPTMLLSIKDAHNVDAFTAAKPPLETTDSE